MPWVGGADRLSRTTPPLPLRVLESTDFLPTTNDTLMSLGYIMWWLSFLLARRLRTTTLDLVLSSFLLVT